MLPRLAPKWRTLIAGSALAVAVIVVYSNSRSVPLLLDDAVSITQNHSIDRIGSALSSPSGLTVVGRPLLNLSFAVNHALGGEKVLGYHVFNVLVHLLAALALFGVARRTLLRPLMNGRFQSEATGLALAIATVWAVHPVQTESVTYISQRAESLMALFYLLSLYCFIRSVESKHHSLWQLCSVLACLTGAMCKEPIVTAPVIILLYDRTFVASSFGESWRRRWRYYLGLACTWLLLAGLMSGLGKRGAGFGWGITWWSYALTSCKSIATYLKLSFWPHPLVFDYGPVFIHRAASAAPYALVLAALLGCVLVALRQWPTVGFVGACFFVILSPTSSVVPVALQPTAENRLYLPLAAVVALTVLGLHAWIGRRCLPVLAAGVLGLGWMTVQRNEDYRSALILWSDTVAKCPGNPRAQMCLADELVKIPSRTPEALEHYEQALRIDPDSPEVNNNLANALAKFPDRIPEALAHYERALKSNPDYVEAHYNLANELAKIPDRMPEALAHYEHVLRINPDFAGAHVNLAAALAKIPDRAPDALAHYEAALRINPRLAEAHYGLGVLMAKIPGRMPEALAHYEAALQINPDFAEAHYNLATELARIPGRTPEALAHFEAALRINPDSSEAQNNIAVIYASTGRIDEAISHLELSLKLNPANTQARDNLGKLRAMRK